MFCHHNKMLSYNALLRLLNFLTIKPQEQPCSHCSRVGYIPMSQFYRTRENQEQNMLIHCYEFSPTNLLYVVEINFLPYICCLSQKPRDFSLFLLFPWFFLYANCSVINGMVSVFQRTTVLFCGVQNNYKLNRPRNQHFSWVLGGF